MALAVEIRDVRFRYPGAAVDCLDIELLQVEAGARVFLYGPSGSGKSTLLGLIGGVIPVQQGTLNLLGKNIAHMRPAICDRLRADHIGFIFQQFNLIPTLSCLENISVPLLLNGVSRRDAEARSREAMKLVGLESKTREQPTNLSGGQQQRVAIARALVHEPRLIICDEPTSALDKDTGAKIMELLHEVAKAPNRSVIVVTHDTRIFRYADRMTEMEDGRVQRVHESYTDYTHEQET